MSLWIWESRQTGEGQAVLHGCPEVVERYDLDFGIGRRPERSDWPLIEIRIPTGERGILTDALLAQGTTGEAFSPRLRELLAVCGVMNIEYHPLRLIRKKKVKPNDDYRIANIIGTRDCIDPARSRVKRSRSSGAIQFIDRLVLDESKSDGLKMFRPSEFLPLLIVTEDVKAAVEKAGMTGVAFFSPGEFTL